MELRQLQREMQSGLLEGRSAIEAHIADTPPLTTEARLAIYRHAYVARLIEALQNYYPVLYQILGDEDFEALGAAFVRTHPSVHRSIRWYGQEVAAFLRVELPFAEQPILAEIACFEWRLAESFDSADAVVLDRAALASVEPAEWADLTFRFHPSVQRLTLEWNTVAVWKAISAEEAPPAPERSANAIEWLIWRRNLENYFRSLDSEEITALDAALEGCNFAQVCDALSRQLPARRGAAARRLADRHLARRRSPLRSRALTAARSSRRRVSLEMLCLEQRPRLTHHFLAHHRNGRTAVGQELVMEVVPQGLVRSG